MKADIESSCMRMFQRNSSEADSQDHPFAMHAHATYVRIPGAFICGYESPGMRTLADTVKFFIAKTSTEMFTVEIRAHSD